MKKKSLLQIAKAMQLVLKELLKHKPDDELVQIALHQEAAVQLLVHRLEYEAQCRARYGAIQ